MYKSFLSPGVPVLTGSSLRGRITLSAHDRWSARLEAYGHTRYRWCGEISSSERIIDRPCLDNYDYPMPRAYLRALVPPLPPSALPRPLRGPRRLSSERPRLYLISMIDCRYRLSKLHTLKPWLQIIISPRYSRSLPRDSLTGEREATILYLGYLLIAHCK